MGRKKTPPTKRAMVGEEWLEALDTYAHIIMRDLGTTTRPSRRRMIEHALSEWMTVQDGIETERLRKRGYY